MKDSARLLRDAGHEVFFVGERIVRQVPKCEGYTLIQGLSSLHWLSSRAQVKALHRQVIDYLSTINADVVHLIDQFDYRLIRTLNQNFPTVMTSHTVATTCPASTRLVSPNGVCQKRSGWSCWLHQMSYHCLDHLKSDLRRAHAIENFRLRQRELKKLPKMFAISNYVKDCLLREGWDPNKIERL